MLDQNTDRMWYVIGAVIVGAALIFLMNGTFPTLFANIGETFEEKVGQTTEMTDGIQPIGKPRPNLIGADDLRATAGEVLAYDAESSTWTLLVNESAGWWNQGLRPKDERVLIPYGETYTLSYEIYIPEHTPMQYAAVDINALPMEGVAAWDHRDNDAPLERLYNGQQGVWTDQRRGVDIPLTSGEWTKVWVTFSNTSSKNTAQVALYDWSNIGVNNMTGKPLEVKIRNIKGELSDRPTPYVNKATAGGA